MEIIPYLYFPFSFVVFLSLFKLLFQRSKATVEHKFPPGPWKLPLIGNMHHLALSLPHHALRDLANKHGPLMHLQLGEIFAIVISSARVAKEVLKTHDLAFANRPELLATKIMAYNNTDISFTPYGNYWRQMRRICTSELLSTQNVLSFSFIREEEVQHLIESIRSSCGSPVNLTEKIFSLINAITCRAAFGKRCKEQDALIELIRESITLSGGFDVADLFPSLKFLHVLSGLRPKSLKIHKKIDQILDNIVQEHRENVANRETAVNFVGEEEDLVDVLVRLQESESNLFELPVTPNNIKAILADIFTAGTETSSRTVEWAMAEMTRNPRVMEKAQFELRQALKGKKTIQETDIQKTSYLKLVIKETLRLHPPAVLIPRESREQCEIEGYKIPIKTMVIVNTWAIGRDPEFWNDAENFKPERFEDSGVNFTGSNNMEYIPFGAGRRMCPGVSFGIANVELPLAQLLYHFNWQLPDGKKPQDLDMSEAFGATVGRKNNLLLIPIPQEFL